jgi:hypothetical protein
MHRKREPVLFPFSKPSKEQLVDFINYKNDRLFAPEQISFGLPALLEPTGLSTVDLMFVDPTGWTSDKAPFRYNRVDIAMLIGGPFVIWVKEHTEEAVYQAILEQYGILIEKDVSELNLISRSLVDITPVHEIPSFDAVDEEDSEVVEPFPPALDNRNYVLAMLPGHLLWYGNIKVHTRRAIEGLGTSIDSRMDLREFYKTGSYDLPRVDLLTPNGVYLLCEQGISHKERRAYESVLYGIAKGTILGTDTTLAAILSQLTGDPWVAVDGQQVDFNLRGSEVVYNGFVSKDFPSHVQAYNYVIAINLGELCGNLTGLLKIAYRYADTNTPSDLLYDRSHVMTVFQH